MPNLHSGHKIAIGCSVALVLYVIGALLTFFIFIPMTQRSMKRASDELSKWPERSANSWLKHHQEVEAQKEQAEQNRKPRFQTGKRK